MIDPAALDLRANRWAPFVQLLTIENADLTSATFAAQVRAEFDTPGTALVSLINASSSAQGVSVSVAAGPISTIQLRINESTMEGMPAAAEVGADLDLAWDLHVTRPGFAKEVWFRGTFTVVAGATQ